MKLLRDDEVPAPPTVASYQETQWSGLFVGLGLSAGAPTLVIWALWEGLWTSPWLLSILIFGAFIVLMMGRFGLRTFLASRRCENWRIRWSSDGLYLRYRSYLNEKFPADTPTVLHLKNREVAWVCPHKTVLETPDEKGSWSFSRKHNWLEVGLRDVDTKPIQEALANESRLRTPGGGRVNDYPVSITRDGTLRIGLNNPGAAALALRLSYTVRPAQSSNSEGFNEMTQSEREDHVLNLAQAGETFAAIKAAREVYALDLKDAKEFVEGLRSANEVKGEDT